MKLSTKGRYATRIMLYLAIYSGQNPVRKHEIAAQEKISPDYVEQILMMLRGAGLVKSHRGAKGGFSLSRAAEAITMADILAATEGPLQIAPCSNTED